MALGFQWYKQGPENGWPFFEDGTFCRLLIAVPLKMYSKFGQPKWILVGQMLKLVGKWSTFISSTGFLYT